MKLEESGAVVWVETKVPISKKIGTSIAIAKI
jgi:hypothetical protein